MSERVGWIGPRPMSAASGTAPAVLGFRTDDFMVELVGSLTTGLDDVVARPETWRDEVPPTFPLPPPPTDTSTVTKLYQPAHGRFYLVAAHLVCRRVGQPDRRLDPGESVGFVVRRHDAGTEYAWIAQPGGGHWARVTDPYVVDPAEDVLPLAPTTHDHRGRRSQLFTGLVPVGARERYEARGPADGTTPPDGEASALEIAVIDTVVAPLATLIDDFARIGAAERADLIELALVDLVDWLQLVDVSLASLPSSDAPFGLDDVAFGAVTWRQVIADVGSKRDGVLSGESTSLARLITARSAVEDFVGATADLTEPIVRIEPSGTPLGQALAKLAPSTTVPPPDDAPPPQADTDAEYVFRTVYHRDGCARPRAEWVSEPTEPFRFAAFFDPDAPARPVQIALPVDTSPRGLRQFPRNVSVLVSSQLRKQMTQVNKEFETGPGQDFSLGKLCTLSIPIITICALILLMIIVTILNLVFFWLPFFQVCLPMSTPEPEDGP